MKQIISDSLTLFIDDIFKAKKQKLDTKNCVFIGVGGNLGDCKRRFGILINHLRQNSKIKILAISPLLKNPPFGFVDQNDFLNFVLAIKTKMSANDLFLFLKQREDRFKRERKFKNAPRTLDLDIIFFENQKIKTKKLTIPHPYYQSRQSVVLPLSSIANIKQIKLQKAKTLTKKKVLVGLSGGIDSSVSAMMLQKEGYEVEGVYMKLHSVSEDYHKNNLEAVAKVANYLGIKYHILDIEENFRQEVFDYFVLSYKAGITPNPCVKCNQKIKFGAMFEFMKSIGADFLATGHYASTDGKFIYEAQDKSKDQSYFLAQIKKEVLPFLIFPMNKYQKEEIKKIGAKLPAFRDIATKKESQEICFVPSVYTDILKEFFEIDKSGKVVDSSGKVIGNHKGYMHYTIGKRRGFTVNGAHDAHFVTQIDPQNNVLVVGKKEDLAINFVEINELNMFIQEKTFECFVKLRYRSHPSKCKVEIFDDKAKITLFEPAFGVAVGQTAVFYDGEKLIGSGWIIKASE